MGSRIPAGRQPLIWLTCLGALACWLRLASRSQRSLSLRTWSAPTGLHLRFRPESCLHCPCTLSAIVTLATLRFERVPTSFPRTRGRAVCSFPNLVEQGSTTGTLTQAGPRVLHCVQHGCAKQRLEGRLTMAPDDVVAYPHDAVGNWLLQGPRLSLLQHRDAVPQRVLKLP